MKRSVIAVIMVIAGFALQFWTYFFLAAPIGNINSELLSNPRVPYSPLIFIVGVMLVFSAALVYELLPEKDEEK